MLLQGLYCSKAALAKAAHSGSPDGMVLRMLLQLFSSFKGKATLTAPVFVDMAIRNWHLKSLAVEVVDVRLEGTR